MSAIATTMKASSRKILLYMNAVLFCGIGLKADDGMPKSRILPITAVEEAPEIKVSIENSPIPVPACSFVNVRDTVFDIAICIKDCPRTPKIIKKPIQSGDRPTTEEKLRNPIKRSAAAVYTRNGFPFSSASLPPLRPNNAVTIADGSITSPVEAGSISLTFVSNCGIRYGMLKLMAVITKPIASPDE